MQFRQHKYSVYEISSGNEFSVPEMAQGGYNIANMREANKRVFDGANGVSPTFANDKVRESYTATDFKQQGIDAKQTRAFGYSISHMKDCGFTTGEFHATGFDIGDIRGVGFTPINYNHGGYTAAAVYSIGFHSCSHFKGGAYEADMLAGDDAADWMEGSSQNAYPTLNSAFSSARAWARVRPASCDWEIWRAARWNPAVSDVVRPAGAPLSPVYTPT